MIISDYCRYNVDINKKSYIRILLSYCNYFIIQSLNLRSHYTGGVGVVGSNPAAPTKKNHYKSDW
jgi:uncharacterized protein affecting Mg2+/Co2+ transport